MIKRIYIKILAWLVMHGFLRVLLFLGLVRKLEPVTPRDHRIFKQGGRIYVPSPDYPRKHRRTWQRCPVCSGKYEAQLAFLGAPQPFSVRCEKPGVPAHPSKYELAKRKRIVLGSQSWDGSEIPHSLRFAATGS